MGGDGEGRARTRRRRHRRDGALFPAAGWPAPADDGALGAAIGDEPVFARWVEQNIAPHKVPGYAIVTISLKEPGVTPGDCTAEQMERVADLADR